MTRARQLLDDYNAVSSEISPHFSPLVLSDVFSADADISKCAPDVNTSTTVPLNVKRDIIDSHFMMKRCEEELTLLRAEMSNTLVHWTNSLETTKKNIDTMISHTNPYSKGVVSLLHRRL